MMINFHYLGNCMNFDRIEVRVSFPMEGRMVFLPALAPIVHDLVTSHPDAAVIVSMLPRKAFGTRFSPLESIQPLVDIQ